MKSTGPTSTVRNSDVLEDPSTGAPGQTPVNVEEIKARIHHQLVETLDLAEARRLPMETLHRECSYRVDRLLDEQKCPLSAVAREQLLSEVMDEIFGLGPLERFLRDSTVSDILVNGPDEIHVERKGLLSRTDATFRDDQHLIQVIQRIAMRVGRRIDESSPMLDAQLEDGCRANAIIPPLALDGAALSIRRFGTVPFDGQGLCELGTWAPEMVTFMEACVRGKVNVLVSGGTGSGKTTLLNAMSKWIPAHERVITIEDAAELQLQGKHVVRLETRPPNIE
ncbi:MAG: CpaF family protein, partial [Planctomycetota bacterium]